MKDSSEDIRTVKQLYLNGCTKEQLYAMGFRGPLIQEAIRRADRSFRLPTMHTRTKRCKCGNLVYENYFVGELCQGCHTRNVVNEQWKGRFRV